MEVGAILYKVSIVMIAIFQFEYLKQRKERIFFPKYNDCFVPNNSVNFGMKGMAYSLDQLHAHQSW